MSLFKTIVVKEATDKGKNIKIVDQDKMKFTLWKTDARNGMVNPAFSAYQATQGVGATIEIEYVEKPSSFTGTDGKLVEYTDRTIYNVSVGQTAMQTGKSSPSPVSSSKGSVNTEFRNWDKEAYEKCCSIWAAGYMAHNTDSGDIEKWIAKGAFWELFQAIRKDGEKRFATGWDKAAAIFGSDDYEAGNKAIEDAQAAMVDEIPY